MTNHGDVERALGGCLSIEDFGGDLVAATQRARGHGAESERTGLGRAEVLLLQGRVAWLRGDARVAFDHLRQAEACASDPVSRLLIAAYQLVSLCDRFMHFPDGAGYLASELAARCDMPIVQQHQAEVQRLVDALPSEHADARHAALFLRMLADRTMGRQLLRSADQADTATIERRKTLALDGPWRFLQEPVPQGAEQHRIGQYRQAFAQRLLADLLHRVGDEAKAHQWLARAQATYQGAGDLAGAAACWLDHGDWVVAPAASPVSWNQQLAERELRGLRQWLREAHGAGVPATLADRDRAAGLASYAEADALFERAGAPRGRAAVTLRRAYLEACAGAFESAIDLSAQAAARFTALGDGRNAQVALAHGLLARVGHRSSDVGLNGAVKLGQWGQESGSMAHAFGLGLLFSDVGNRWLAVHGDAARALACHDLARALFDALEAKTNVAKALEDRSVVHKVLRDTPAAIVDQQEAVLGFTSLWRAQRRKPASPHAEAPVLADTPLVTWQRAVQATVQLSQLYTAEMNADGLADAIARLETIYGEDPAPGQPGLFGAGFEDSLPRQVSEVQRWARFQIPLFRALSAVAQEPAVAEAWFAEAQREALAAPEPERFFMLANHARLCRRFDDARAAYLRFLDAGGKRPMLAGDLAHRLARQFGMAGKSVMTEGIVDNHRDAAYFFARCRAYTEARTHLEQVESLAGRSWWRREERAWEACTVYGLVAEGLGEWNDALAHYDRAISLLDAWRGLLTRDEQRAAFVGAMPTRQLFFVATRCAYVRRQVHGCREAGAADKARDQMLAYAQQGKARALLDLVVESTANEHPHVESAPRFAYRQASAQLTIALQRLVQDRAAEALEPSRLAASRERVARAEATLREAAAAWADRPFVAAHPASFADLVAALPRQTVLLEYYGFDDGLLAWAISAEGTFEAHHHDLDLRVLDGRIYELHGACVGQELFDAAATYLSSHLLQPFSRILGGARHLIIVPSGAAHRLPFHVLPWQAGTLGERFTITYLPSNGLLPKMNRSADPGLRGPSLVVGNPGRMRVPGKSESAGSLPAAELEAVVAGNLLPNSIVLTGDQATKDSVLERLSQARVVHLATHGLLSTQAPLESSLLLADGAVLTVAELMGVQLKADLVVLSACSSGLGHSTGGEDVLGLARALLATGARTAVVSLWRVDDKSTSLFMSHFYEEIRRGATPSRALQSAQAYLRALRPNDVQSEQARLEKWIHPNRQRGAILREVGSTQQQDQGYSHPYHWAPFIVIGRT